MKKKYIEFVSEVALLKKSDLNLSEKFKLE